MHARDGSAGERRDDGEESGGAHHVGGSGAGLVVSGETGVQNGVAAAGASGVLGRSAIQVTNATRSPNAGCQC